jgi:uncharacterized protein
MKKIALLSDTHGYVDDAILTHCMTCDEVWHAGDFGTTEVSDRLSSIQELRGVYGNVDGHELRLIHPLEQKFSCEEVNVWMIHIGGYPGRYHYGLKDQIKANPPGLFICGHSHVLKVMRDASLGNMLHINPGAAGKHGFHKERTMVNFKIDKKRIFDLEVLVLGKK